MGERRYWIRAGLLQRIIDAFKAVVVAYHGATRKLPKDKDVTEIRAELRRVADESDSVAEAIKYEIRKQDGLE